MSNTLPEELLILILQEVENISDLLQVRFASQTLNTLATPFIFRVVEVKDQIRSAIRLLCLQAGAAGIRAAVREEIPFSSEARWKAHWQKSATRARLCAAYSRLDRFSNLQALYFDFGGFRSASEYRDLQLGLFTSLAAQPPRQLSSLTLLNVVALLDNLYPFWPTIYLRKGTSSKGPCCTFSSMHAASPHSLSMGFSHLAGAEQALPLSSMRFPTITHLKLDNFVLDHTRPDSDALQFIVRHKATLKHLTLSDCSVYGGEHEHPQDGVFPRPWHRVFQTLQDELVQLRSFRSK
ncbi:hypothetical protein R3P38DRAFT_3183848 [Favolaschia claudopus]|uniref:F-box domain-containing protein n=1 Tax=Favolaschia claudopus TaxID=2862362 RepID=A0AAW0CAX3_9AGAR